MELRGSEEAKIRRQVAACRAGALVREGERFELQAEEPLLIDADGRELENRMCASPRQDGGEEAVERQSVRRGSRGRPLLVRNAENERARQSRADARSAKRAIDQVAYGRFSFCAADADEREVPVSVAEQT